MSTRRRFPLTRPLLSLAAASVALTTACKTSRPTPSIEIRSTHEIQAAATTTPVAAPPEMLSPLLLANGQPACGNTGSKAPKPPGCS